MIKIEFDHNIDNVSLQVGDTAYYVTPTSSGGFANASTDPIKLGEIKVINADNIEVDEVVSTLSDGDFIMFQKDRIANISGLKGYYAKIKLENDSTDKAELFSLGSEVTASSK